MSHTVREHFADLPGPWLNARRVTRFMFWPLKTTLP